MLCLLVLHDDVVGRVGDDDGIGQRVHDRLHELDAGLEPLGDGAIRLLRGEPRQHRPCETHHPIQAVDRLGRRTLRLDDHHAGRRATQAPARIRRGHVQLASRREIAAHVLRNEAREPTALRLRVRQGHPASKRQVPAHVTPTVRAHRSQRQGAHHERMTGVVDRQRQRLGLTALEAGARDFDEAIAIDHEQRRTGAARRISSAARGEIPRRRRGQAPRRATTTAPGVAPGR